MTQPKQTTSARTRVLLVDDDPRLLVTLSRGLNLRGFEVTSADSAGGAVPHLEAGRADILILDVAMPGIDGVSFCRLIRDRFPLPILMLTARDEVSDRVAGLRAGADDYMVKPFALDELVARLETLLRRADSPKSRILSFEDVRLDRDRWVASRSDRDLELTATEFRILERLLLHPTSVIPRDDLYDAVWRDGMGPETNSLDVHVANLRRKLEAGGECRLIHVVRGVGFKLQAP
jgi:DNA-binding response OmpR family regulator